MTKAEEKAKLEKQHDREVLVSRAKLVMIVVCMFAIVGTFLVNHWEAGDIKGRVAKVESPCLKYGSKSRQCHKSFSAAIRSITDYQLCSLLSQRPDLTHVHPSDCQKIAEEARHHAEQLRESLGGAEPSSVAAVSSSGGDATTTGTPGSSQPAPGNGGSNGQPSHHHPSSVPGGHGGGEDVPSPPSSSSESSSSTSSSQTTERVESTVVETAPEAAAPVGKAVGGVVEEVGSTVTGTVGGVTETTCSLAKVLC